MDAHAFRVDRNARMLGRSPDGGLVETHDGDLKLEEGQLREIRSADREKSRLSIPFDESVVLFRGIIASIVLSLGYDPWHRERFILQLQFKYFPPTSSLAPPL